VFITLEGPDGAGKTTQAALLVNALRAMGRTVVPVHEPGGTDLGAHIRAVLVARGGIPIDPWAEALLFSACRAQLVTEVIGPALARGEIVVADRFADSTLAYQGAGRGLDVEQLRSLIRAATQGLKPDLTILLDLPAHEGLGRAEWNRFEDEGSEFQERVRAAYHELVREEPGRWRVVDATQPVAEVTRQIVTCLGATIS
jgi:dTMP kinase